MSRQLDWAFTLNNPQLSKDEVEDILSNAGKYWVFQRERSSTGTVHFQGYIRLHRRKRRASLKKLLSRAHWTACKGSAGDNKAYCTKEDTRLEGPWEGGEFPGTGSGQGKRSDLNLLYEAIKSGASHEKLFEEHTTSAFKYRKGINDAKIVLQPKRDMDNFEPDVRLYIGPTGCGKTRAVFDEFDKADIYECPLGKNLWFDGLDGHKVVLIDDFGGNMGLTTLLKLLDTRYVRKVGSKGAHVWWNPEIVIITTNNHPTTWYSNTGLADTRRGNFRALARRFTLVREWKDPRANPILRLAEDYEPIVNYIDEDSIYEYFNIYE